MRGSVIALVVVAASAGPAFAGDSGCEYPNVMFVVDRSNSMSDPLCACDGGGSKFDIALRTIERALAMFGGQVRFGLTMFPWGGDCGAGQVLVPMDFGAGGNITSQMRAEAARPGGATPMAATLQALAPHMSSAAVDRRNFVLLITDGAETCATGHDDLVMAVSTVFSTGTTVFVIGYGSAVDAETLDAIATAGGTNGDGTGPGYYKADDEETLDASLLEIIGFATAEICDGKDNDCNGVVDDIEPERCRGPCGVVGSRFCEEGFLSECLDESGAEISSDAADCENASGGSFGDRGCSCSSLGLEQGWEGGRGCGR